MLCRRNLDFYRQKFDTSKIPGRDEIKLEKYGFEYGEDFHLNPRTNFLSYQLRALSRPHFDIKSNPTFYVCVRMSRRALPPAEVVYDKVGVVPLRAHYNVFHIAEGLNTLLRYLMKYEHRFPVGVENEHDT